MNRRTYLAGFGSIAAGAAMLGTAATTTFGLNNRTANVNIVSDNPSGSIGFDIQNKDSDVIRMEDGKVEIDLGEPGGQIGTDGGNGVNVGSVVNVGTIDSNDRSNSEPSLEIINQTSYDEVVFTFDFDNVSGSDLGPSALNLTFELQDPAGNVDSVDITDTTNKEISSATGVLDSLNAGEAYLFALTVDAEGAPTGAHVSLDLSITAETP